MYLKHAIRSSISRVCPSEDGMLGHHLPSGACHAMLRRLIPNTSRHDASGMARSTPYVTSSQRSISRYVTSSQTERAVLRHFILSRGVILRHSLPYDGACHPHCSLDVRRACGLSRLVISLYLLSIAHPLPLLFFSFNRGDCGYVHEISVNHCLVYICI